MDRPSGSSGGGLGPRYDPSSRIQKPEPAADRMAALKARVAAAIGGSKAKGGLNVGLHPALEDLGGWKSGNKAGDAKGSSGGGSSGSSRAAKAAPKGDPKQKKPASTGPSVAGGQSNPYYEEATGSQASHARQKQSRQLIFNQKGKYIQQANALRKQAALEALKKRIAQQTRRAGMDEDLEGEKNFVVEAPPELEWFDAGLVDGKSYDSIEEPGSLKIDTDDSIITAFIQHPVPLEPPQDALVPVAKPLYLTPKEQARLRRQRRSAALKEEQSQISLGLIPAPPPKIKKGNLMRVLGSIDDPTAVELRVNQEIAARHQKHTAANEERKLTKEQMHEKLVANQERDASKGLHMMVFKIGSLVNGSHRYKIGVNAEQLFLTGMCIMSPRFSLVIVEGGEWSMTKYRKLLMNRMDWTENAPSRDREEKKAALREWLRAEDEGGGLKDLSKNQCTLVFKGEVKSRAFKRFYSRVAESDAEAREILSRVKMEAFWGQAKSAP